MCLAQEFIDEKTNEIPAVQEILKLMNLEGMIVTVDAMNCQKDPVSAIAGRKGDYVLALKGNHPLFCGEVQGFFDEEKGKRSGKAKKDIKRPGKRNIAGLHGWDTTSRRMWAGTRTGSSGKTERIWDAA